jgi:soluble cytochrome b562
MTKKQMQDFNKMRNALIEITKYQTPDKLRRDSEKDWGVEFEEALEMAYENIQTTAKYAVKGVRALNAT